MICLIVGNDAEGELRKRQPTAEHDLVGASHKVGEQEHRPAEAVTWRRPLRRPIPLGAANQQVVVEVAIQHIVSYAAVDAVPPPLPVEATVALFSS